MREPRFDLRPLNRKLLLTFPSIIDVSLWGMLCMSVFLLTAVIDGLVFRKIFHPWVSSAITLVILWDGLISIFTMIKFPPAEAVTVSTGIIFSMVGAVLLLGSAAMLPYGLMLLLIGLPLSVPIFCARFRVIRELSEQD